MNTIDRNYAPLQWLVAFLMTALVAGCGGGGGQDPILGNGGNAGLAPTVISVTPVPNAIGVPINTKIVTATFSAAMDPVSLSTASFTLACPAGTPVTGVVSYVAAGNLSTLTLAVATNLPASTLCTATITTGAKSAAGIPLDSNFAWKFTTGLVPDTTAPTVTGTINANGATGVAFNTKVGATFSEVMDPLTINATTFTLKQGTTAVAGTVTYAGVNAIFTPSTNLSPSTTYTVTVTTGAKDVRGNPLASDFVISWTTGVAPDTTAPTVTGTINANGATNVAINTASGVTFSEAMDPLTVTNVNFTLTTDAGAAVPGTVSYSGVSAVFRPLSNLANSTHYNVTVKGGLTGVKDLAGNPMAADFKIAWTTAAAPDTTAPTVTGTINANGATNVAINTAAGATFSEGMDPLTITNVNYTVTTDAGAAVPGIVSYSGVSAVFRPLVNLANSTHYNVTIKGGLTGVKDLAGNPMAADFKIGWTTAVAPDTTAPTVVRTIQTNGQTNVAVNTTVGATFSEGMDPLTITNLNFNLKATATGVTVPGTIAYSGVSATFIPLAPLAFSTNYTVTVKSGASGVKDLAGNPMAGDFTISWTTGVAPDTTAPTVLNTINANGATNVAVNTAVGASFSEGMDPLTVTNLNFLLATDAGVAVPGTINYSGVNVVFQPLAILAGNTHYNATVKGAANGVKDLAGNAMVNDYKWSWTTGVAPDIIAPTVISTFPLANANGVATTAILVASFSEPMDPLTINSTNITLVCGGTPFTGIGSYDTNGRVVTEALPAQSFPAGSTCTATISTGVKDLAGNAMANPYSWTFSMLTGPTTTTTTTTVAGTTTTTIVASGGVCVGAACVDLGTAANYVALTKTGISTVGTTAITGNIGVSPAAASFITGFGLIADSTNTFSTSSLVTGKVYAADYSAPTPSNISTAISDMETAYTAAAAKAPSGGSSIEACPAVGAMSDANNIIPFGGSGALPAGVYTCAVNVTIPGNLTLNGSATDVWVFKITGKLTQASATSVLLTGGALAKNVFWQVSDTVNIGTTAHMEGIILAQTNIALQNGASLKGRFLAQTAVTLDANTIVAP